MLRSLINSAKAMKGSPLGHLDKSIGILIVDSVSAVASTVKRVLQELGYKNLYQADSVLDGLNTIGSQSVSWIFTSLFEGQRYTGRHFLRLPLEIPAYRQITTSVLLNSEENDSLPLLYALGMISCHVRPITYNSFRAELERFLSRLQNQAALPLAVAPDLRDFLQIRGAIDEIERLELGLFRTLDSSPQQQLRVIQSQLKAGNNIEGLIGLKQLQAHHPECEAAVNDLSKKYLGIDSIATYQTALNINLALIVDSDEAQQRFLADVLREMGVVTSHCFASPDEAIAFLQKDASVDLIISEWKLKGMEGGSFLQHAKLGVMREKPFVVYSSLVGETDQKLIEEVGGSFVLPKPLSKKAFREALSDIYSRWRYPVEGEDIEQKIYQSLQSGDFAYAKQMIMTFEDLPKVDKQRKGTAQAALAYHEGEYLKAKALIIEASKLKLPTYREIAWLGKILLKLGEFADAQKCLDQANQMVPGHLERLCQMADASAGMGREADAMKYVTEARRLGPAVDQVKASYAQHAAVSGRGEGDARAYMESEDIARGVVAHMNNLGVAYAAAGKWKESIEAYVKSLRALGSLHEDLQATVLYNLGLSLVRQDRYKEALPVLKQSGEKAGLQLAKKVAQLSEKVQGAIASKTKLNLKETPKEISPDASLDGRKASAFHSYVVQSQIKPGEHALFGIYEIDGPRPFEGDSEYPRLIKSSA